MISKIVRIALAENSKGRVLRKRLGTPHQLSPEGYCMAVGHPARNSEIIMDAKQRN